MLAFGRGAQSLQRAIEEMPEENAAAHVRDQIFTYTPHFWLGIARLNAGDPDGALREWKISEDQGAIRSTPYFAQLRDLIARANSEKQRRAERNAAPSKQEANGAIGRALSAQMDAVTAGGDRGDTYHAAQRKLSESRDAAARAGTDIKTYKRAGDLADEARGLFSAAADEARRQKAARPAKSAPVLQHKADIVVPFAEEPQPKQVVQPHQAVALPAPAPVVPVPHPQPEAEMKKAPPPVPQPQPQPESEALVAARIAVQQYRRHLLSRNRPSSDAQRMDRELKSQSDPATIRRIVEEVSRKEHDLDAPKSAAVTVTAPPSAAPAPSPAAPSAAESSLPRQQLEAAYRLFASGDLTGSERTLTAVLVAHQNAEAYLLRGCARYTQGILSRHPGALVASAASDMQAAFRLNHALQLDRVRWSPKLVAFYEQVKQGKP